MSVFKRKDSPFYRFNFNHKGQRFSGSTERTSKRDAEVVEKAKREEVKRLFAAGALAAGRPMTIDEAAGRYWDEVGQHASDSKGIEWSLAWIATQLGPDKPIRDIVNDDVARLVARRRLEPSNRGAVARKRAKGGKVGPQPRLAPATVNRSVTQPLRRVLKRAAELWGEQVTSIRWRDHMLGEPKERVRYMSEEEEAAVFAVLPDCYKVLVSFAALAGCRAGECLRMTWSDIDWGERRFTVTGKGWRGNPKVRTVPLSAAMRDLLWPFKGAAKPGDRIFRNTTGGPATYRGYSAAWVKARAAAGVTNLRIHDLRHTAATRIVQSAGNLKLAQKLLGHSSIATTAKYTHVLDDDLRDALDAMTREKSHRKVTPKKAKALRSLKK